MDKSSEIVTSPERSLITIEYRLVMNKLAVEYFNQRPEWSGIHRELFIESFVKAAVLLFSDPVKLYRMMSLLDMKSIVGSFALLYNKRLTTSLEMGDIETLVLVLAEPWFESQSGYMTPEISAAVEKNIQEQSIVMNALIDIEITKTKSVGFLSPDTILGSVDHTTCKNGICSIDNSVPQYEVGIVWVPYITKCQTIEKQSFNLRDLIITLYNEDLNPYTGKPFDLRVVENIKRVYAYDMVQRLNNN
jgi:hypothetical protein